MYNVHCICACILLINGYQQTCTIIHTQYTYCRHTLNCHKHSKKYINYTNQKIFVFKRRDKRKALNEGFGDYLKKKIIQMKVKQSLWPWIHSSFGLIKSVKHKLKFKECFFIGFLKFDSRISHIDFKNSDGNALGNRCIIFLRIELYVLSSVILHATLYACTRSRYKHMQHRSDSQCHRCVYTKHVLTLGSLALDNGMYCLEVSYDHNKHFATDSSDTPI